MKNWRLIVSEEIWGLKPFKTILDRDKTKDKEVANAEMLFIWYFCDIKSDYIAMSKDDRVNELKKDIANLPKKWEPDKVIWEAIDFYKKRSITVIQKLYEDSLQSCIDIGDYIRNTKELLEERDNKGSPVYDINKLTGANEKIPKLMANLKASYIEVVKEQDDIENKKLGRRSFNIFEEGLK